MGGSPHPRVPWLATILSIVGIGIVGIGLAYSLHVSADMGERRAAAQSPAVGSPVNQRLSGVAITPGREVIGAISRIDDSTIRVRSAANNSEVDLQLSPQTQVTTTHGGGRADLNIGDVVMIQVSADGKAALAIYAGQISVAGTP